MDNIESGLVVQGSFATGYVSESVEPDVSVDAELGEKLCKGVRVGQQFGRLVAVSFVGRDKHSNAKIECVCSCGKVKVTLANKLRSGHTKSCGCLRRETARARRTTHGATVKGSSLNRLHEIWKNVKTRIFNPRATGYKNWGGRGIKMHEPWVHDFAAFAEYCLAIGYSDVVDGEPSTIERIDNDGHYEPCNISFVGKGLQSTNTRAIRPVRRSDGALFPDISFAARALGLHASAITAVCRGKRKTTGGYGWVYASESEVALVKALAAL